MYFTEKISFNVIVFYFVVFPTRILRRSMCGFFKLAGKTNFRDEKESWIMLITINHRKGIHLANYS